jgi:peptide/nickel transport system permease protein
VTPGLGRFAARRLLGGLLLGLLATLLIFAATELLPGDVARAVLGPHATPEAVAVLSARLGLDQPAVLRYAGWLIDLARGDLGHSLATGQPIDATLLLRFGNSLVLAAVAAAIAVPVSIALGVAAALRPRGRLDRVISVTALCAGALPEFFIATVLVVVLAVRLRWFPAISYVSEFSSVEQLARSLVLPVLTLVLATMAHMTRMTRAALVSLLREPYIEAAVLKGVTPRRIMLVHALPNALAPIVNVVAINLAYLISGALVVETIFAYPGLAKLMIDAVAARDLPMVQACALAFCLTYVLLNLLADLVAAATDPRLGARAARP